MMKTQLFTIGIILILFYQSSFAQSTSNRWKLSGKDAISWIPSDSSAHRDHMEMSGKFISAVIRYGINADRSFWINRDVVWPMLRTIPNNTHASLIRPFNLDPVTLLLVNKKPVKNERVEEILLNGTIAVKSNIGGTLALKRELFPSVDLPCFIEKYCLTNLSNKPQNLEIPEINISNSTNASEGVEGRYLLQIKSVNHGPVSLQPQKDTVFYVLYLGRKVNDKDIVVNPETELEKRKAFLSMLNENLILETPDAVMDRAFSFAKIRASESIYETKGGPMHGPGGLSYYAAIWANDQAEYINPFFPYLGYDYGIASALNAYRQFARFMNPEYTPIPSSIIAEGSDIWNGAGDRGDAAMIAYGASRFALSQGDVAVAEELWPLIEWCLEYNKRHLNDQGVVASNSDELEGRLPSGKANLCTSSLYFDALISGYYLGNALQKDKRQIQQYQRQAMSLKKNIEKYFGATVMGFDTYRYYEGNSVLRAWICMPLTVNILERKQGTIEALFSKQLWTDDGLASVAGEKTFWDRSTLYALRGVLAAGELEKGIKYLHYYSNRRLLGEHVPYPVEAYPEGNQRHLSAESGLYCRIFTEGLFGIRPTGLQSFTLTPQLPDGWNFMRLKNVHGFQHKMDVEVTREGQKIRVNVVSSGKSVYNDLSDNGSRLNISF